MPRIAPVSKPYPSALADRLGRLLPADLPAPQLFLTVARNQALFLHMVDSGWIGPTGLCDRRTLPAALREMLILRTCVAARNDYEWHLHVNTISARMGLTDLQIDDTREPAPNPTLWSQPERAAMAMVDALVSRIDIDDELYQRARAHFDEAQLIEMTHLVGLYTGVAMLVALARPEHDAYSRPRAGQPMHKSEASR